jgi:hypothetical protein
VGAHETYIFQRRASFACRRTSRSRSSLGSRSSFAQPDGTIHRRATTVRWRQSKRDSPGRGISSNDLNPETAKRIQRFLRDASAAVTTTSTSGPRTHRRELRRPTERNELARSRSAARSDPGARSGRDQRRVFAAGGPAPSSSACGGLLPSARNLFGTNARACGIISSGHNLDWLRALVRRPRRPFAKLFAPPVGHGICPARDACRASRGSEAGASAGTETRIGALQQISCRGRATRGPFLTLPQVYTEDPDRRA